MVNISNFESGNGNIYVVDSVGRFKVIAFRKNYTESVGGNSQRAYFDSQMDVCKRQLVIDLQNTGVIVKKGRMQWQVGHIEQTTGVKGIGDIAKKVIRSKLTNDTVIKPEYKGEGKIVLEPDMKHILLFDVGEWGTGLVVDDGMFLACESTVAQKLNARSTVSSTILGKEGLFNLCLSGKGVVALESIIPKDELVIVDIENDELKIDGNMAVAWSESLKFTVEKSGKTLIGSAMGGEGLVNVYRGTGRVLISPLPIVIHNDDDYED